MLAAYCNQTAGHQALTGTNNRGEPVYGSAHPIQCRKRRKTQEILTADRRRVTTEVLYHLTAPVAEGDLLDDRRVQWVSEWVNLEGVTIGWRAAT